MFPLLTMILGCAVLLAITSNTPLYSDPLWLAVVVPSAAAVTAVLLQWLSNPGALRDVSQGGIVAIVQDDDRRLVWVDRAMAHTHLGSIDRRMGVLRLEHRVFFGLIGRSRVVRKCSELPWAQVEQKLIEANRRRRGAFFRHDTERVPSGYEWAIVLTNDSGERLRVLDLVSGLNDARAERFIGDLHRRIEDALATAPARAGAA